MGNVYLLTHDVVNIAKFDDFKTPIITYEKCFGFFIF